MAVRWFWTTAMVVAGLAASGCGGYGAICADVMDCMGGNDADIEACEIQAEAEEERASLNGCEEQHSDYRACFEDKATCSDRVFSDRGYCDREAADLALCTAKSESDGDGSNEGDL